MTDSEFRAQERLLKISVHDVSTGTFVPQLRSLSQILGSILPRCRTRGCDMYPLTKQLQIACDHAKDVTARMISQEPPRFANDEQTLEINAVQFLFACVPTGRRYSESE
jgi:hypothetical protein